MRIQRSKSFFLVIVVIVLAVTIWKSNDMIQVTQAIARSTVNGSLATQDSYEITDEEELYEETEEDELLQEDEFKQTFRYKPPSAAGITALGKTFKIPKDLAEEIASLSTHHVLLNEDTMKDFVVGMAASANHLDETKDGLASIQYHLPNTTVYYYDLGLTPEQIEVVKSWKNVKYRYFDFSKYPKHFFENLRMCAWKPFIIMDILKENGGVLWMDASVRIHSGDFTPVYRQLLISQGLVLFKTTGHSNFAATHKSTYDYIPTRRKMQKELYMRCAAAMMMFNTRDLFHNVLWWWFLCAYEEKCNSPMPKTMCEFDEERRMEVFAFCHKWDQSTINILMSNYHGYNMTKYLVPELHEVMTIERWPTNYYEIKSHGDNK